jgi:hypothetical protein
MVTMDKIASMVLVVEAIVTLVVKVVATFVELICPFVVEWILNIR